MIEVVELSKSFPNADGTQKLAVDRVSFKVQPGEIYGLLGPNGAGKTTTLRMVSGLMASTGGQVFVDGEDVTGRAEVVKRKIGYLTANTGLYARLSPREFLEYFATLYDIPKPAARERIDQLVEWLGMKDFLNLRCGAMSTGQKQRTNIARALIADPPVLVLDEPTLGLDVLTNRVILDFIRSQSRAGKTILLSTHALDEIETMCKRIGLMHNGRLIAEGDLDALRAQSGRQRLSDIFLTLVGSDKPIFAESS